MRHGKKWNGPITASRQQRGAYYTTVPKLITDHDENLPCGRVGTFRNYFRLTKPEYNLVLEKVAPIITKQDTTYRQSIPASERLMVTLRYLATGSSMTQLHYDWCVSVASLSSIIPETCEAIYNELKSDYLKTPSTQDEWQTIAQQMEDVWNFPNALGEYITVMILLE